MAQELFPTFDVPAALAEDAQTVKKYNPAPLWDFEEGDFVTRVAPNGKRQSIYGSGHDAWVQWCRKTMLTQRWAHYGYGPNAGAEVEEAFGEPDRKAIESSLERTVTQALLADPMGRCEQVRDFQFDWHGDELHITCEVLGSDGNLATINTSLKV